MLIVLVAGVGGHLEQAIRLSRHLEAENDEIVFIVDQKTEQVNAALTLERVRDYQSSNLAKSTFNFLKSFFKAYFFLQGQEIRCIVSTGPALAVPVFVAAKMLGISRVHIESWSRIKSVSNTTKILYRFRLAQKIFVQYKDHPYLNNKKADYIGHL